MTETRTTAIATLIVVVTGILWGFYWLPVRRLDAMGLSGAWGTLAITGCAVLVLLPVAFARRAALRRADPVALASLALGGAAFALYSVGFVYGRVAIIILLFFLTPVWSTLIARYLLGWQAPRLRIAAMAVGLLGLGGMLSADGAWPVPRNIGEWMGLASGLLWSVATTGIKLRSTLRPPEAGFVFVLGAALCSMVLAPVLAPAGGGGVSAASLALAAGTGIFWWAVSMMGLMWATVRLEPARVGILLMAEVLIGSLSAALIAGEHLSGLEIAGGGLVLVAGILEVWPVRRAPTAE